MWSVMFLEAVSKQKQVEQINIQFLQMTVMVYLFVSHYSADSHM